MTPTAAGAWKPDYGVPPGEVLAENLEVRGWSQAELARRCGKSAKMISEIISGKNPVEPDTALAFERVLGVKAEIWNGIEADWRLFKAREADRARAQEEVKWVRSFPIRSLKERQIVSDLRDDARLRSELLSFFGVASESAYARRWAKSMVAYRHSKSRASSPESLRVWLRLGEMVAEKAEVPEFNAGRLNELFPALRDLTVAAPDKYVPAVKELCRSAGVVLAIVAPIKDARLSGAAYRLPDGRGVAQLSLRHKTNDHFWFTLFHELAHLMLHKRSAVFVDDVNADDGCDKIEEEADAFAEEKLVGRMKFERFCSQRPRSKAQIEAFARSVGVHPGIVVGMLQHRRILLWTHLNGLKQKMEI